MTDEHFETWKRVIVGLLEIHALENPLLEEFYYKEKQASSFKSLGDIAVEARRLYIAEAHYPCSRLYSQRLGYKPIWMGRCAEALANVGEFHDRSGLDTASLQDLEYFESILLKHGRAYKKFLSSQ